MVWNLEEGRMSPYHCALDGKAMKEDSRGGGNETGKKRKPLLCTLKTGDYCGQLGLNPTGILWGTLRNMFHRFPTEGTKKLLCI